MSTKTWPDPECRGPHKPKQRILRWQHTDACREGLANKVKRNGEPLPDDAALEALTVVERARVVGAL